MQATLWTYPWDVADVGVDETLDDILTRAGAHGLSLAVAYHAGRFVQPRSPRRKVYFPEDGTIYFEPNPNRYGRIKPQVASIVREQGAVLRKLDRAREHRPFRLSGWTVCLHNTRIGMAYPDAATETAFGDRLYHSLCPSQPDVRDYISALVGDLTSRYRLDAIELETPTYMGFGHGYHHEKDCIPLNAREQFLLSICFCEHCRSRAARAGVNAEAARREVTAVIAAACERALPEPGLADDFHDLPAVAEYLRWRSEPVTSLIGEIKESAHPETQVLCMTSTPARAWLTGLDLPTVAKIVDGFLVLAYDLTPEQVTERIAALPAGVPSVTAGLRLAVPETGGATELGARIAAAARGGAQSVNLYNYGLVPATRLDWVREALSRA